MNLYLVQHEGEPSYVEAADIENAIRIWRAWMMKSTGVDCSDGPEGITFVLDDPVIRDESK